MDMSSLFSSLNVWMRAQIVASFSWPISIALLGLFGTFLNQNEPTLLTLSFIGLVAGATTALNCGLYVESMTPRISTWVLVNLVGSPLSLIASYVVFLVESSPAGLVAGGLCSGLIMSAFHCLALERHHSRAGPLISGAFCWTLAFLIGSQMIERRAGLYPSLVPGDFYTAFLLGWCISGTFLMLMLIFLSPVPRYGSSFERNIRW
jgi:hypothetical protein